MHTSPVVSRYTHDIYGELGILSSHKNITSKYFLNTREGIYKLKMPKYIVNNMNLMTIQNVRVAGNLTKGGVEG